MHFKPMSIIWTVDMQASYISNRTLRYCHQIGSSVFTMVNKHQQTAHRYACRESGGGKRLP